MGIFSAKKIVSVASSVYNLAGDEKDRPIFLKNLVVRNILSGTKKSMGETIPTGYLNGPGIKYRSFFRWADREYNLIGMPEGLANSTAELDAQIVADNIPQLPEEVVWVQEAVLDIADYERWVEQWFLANHPDLISADWEADINDNSLLITVKIKNGATYTFTPSGFDPDGKYIYAYYVKSLEDIPDPIVTGSLFHLVPGAPFPALTDFTLVDTATINRPQTLTKTVTTSNTYSDDRPPDGVSTTTQDDVIIPRTTSVFNKWTFNSNASDTDAKVTTRTIRNHFEDQIVQTNSSIITTEETLPDGVVMTTITMTTEDMLVADNSYRTDRQQITAKTWQNMQLFIYKIGGNNPALNALAREATSYGKFFPAIPVRMNNDFVSDPEREEEWGDIYDLAKRAYKKATDGSKLDSLIDELSENESLKDMDYIFVVFGVSLNTIDISARRYIYVFLRKLMETQIGGTDVYEQFQTKMTAYNTAFNKWLAWKAKDSYQPSQGGGETTAPGLPGVADNPDPEPKIPPRPTLPHNQLTIKNPGQNVNYRVFLHWNYIGEFFHNGKGKTGAKKGDVWLQFVKTTDIRTPIYGGRNDNPGGVVTPGQEQSNYAQYQSFDTTRIYWQYEDNKYKYMDLVGLKHENNIYRGKSVKISAKEALEDAEESGFIVPLHYGTFRELPLVHATQMSTAMVFLQINSYQITKQHWYEKGFFKVIFIVAIAILSVTFTGGAGLGILGSHMALGGALGLTGMTAAIVGSIVNSLAALILSTMLEKITAKMGLIGAIISSVVGIIASGALGNLTSGMNFNITNLMKADNLLKLLDAGSNAYSAYVQGSIMDMQNEMTAIQEETNAESRKVREQYTAQFGYGGGTVDPLMLVDNNPVMAESRDTFLTRTLMNGGDIADMTQELLSNFTELTLTLPDAFT